jgi:hypothetical protein
LAGVFGGTAFFFAAGFAGAFFVAVFLTLLGVGTGIPNNGAK